MWDNIKADMMALFREFHGGSTHISFLNYFYIALVPKMDGANSASDFQAKALENLMVKLILLKLLFLWMA